MCAVASFRGSWGGIQFSKSILYFVAKFSPSSWQIFDYHAGSGERGEKEIMQGTSDSSSPLEPLWV